RHHVPTVSPIVHENETRIVDERSSYGHPLPVAGGQCVHLPVQIILKLERFCERFYPPLSLGRLDSVELREEPEISPRADEIVRGPLGPTGHADQWPHPARFLRDVVSHHRCPARCG